METPRNIPLKYSPSVRLGNWYEDMILKEKQIIEYIETDTRKKLPNKEIIHDNYLKSVELSEASDFIRFGDTVQLSAPEMKTNPKYNYLPVLSALITEDMVLGSKPINEECELCITPSIKPCISNCFKIVSADHRDRTGEILKYDQKFMLKCLSNASDNDKDPLLLYSCPNSANLTNNTLSSYKSFLHQPIGLILQSQTGNFCNIPRWHCFWKCIHKKPILRFETAGDSVPSNTPLVIAHVATNQNLAAERFLINTAFGKACLVSVKDCKDSHRIEQWPNIWQIVIKK